MYVVYGRHETAKAYDAFLQTFGVPELAIFCSSFINYGLVDQ